MATMKNWSITSNQNGFIPQELLHYYLQGNVYDREEFNDGAFIRTSKIVKITEHEDYKIVKTRNTEYIVYKDDVDVEYEKQFPNAYNRLNFVRDIL